MRGAESSAEQLGSDGGAVGFAQHLHHGGVGKSPPNHTWGAHSIPAPILSPCPGAGRLRGVGGMSAGRGGSPGREERLGAEPAHLVTTPTPG